jgi:hypothetical protein
MLAFSLCRSEVILIHFTTWKHLKRKNGKHWCSIKQKLPIESSDHKIFINESLGPSGVVKVLVDKLDTEMR